MSRRTSSLKQLKVLSLVIACIFFGAARSFAQTGCPETPQPGAGRAATLGAEAQAVRPGAGKLYMMQAPRKPAAIAKAEVQVVCVPDFTGMTLDQAKAAIERTKGLHFENATPPNGGTVTDQNPKPFRYVAINTGVTLQLKAPESAPRLRLVPDITRLDESSVEPYLKRAGLQYGGSRNSETNEYPAGAVFQDPAAGKWVEENTRVFRYQATAPPQQQTDYQLTLRPSAAELSINEQVRFEAFLTPAVNGTGYAFDFGDGMKSDLSGENTAPYQYAKDGTFTLMVTARLPSGDFRQARTVVQVHAISWTVVLQPDVRRADTNTTILFEARVLPSSPAPERAQYWFYFDDDQKGVISNTPGERKSFSRAGTHWARVVVRDADGHTFRSDTVAVIVVSPVWPWAIASVVALTLLGVGGLQVARKVATTGLRYNWTADVRGVQRITVVPGGVVDSGFEFRIVRPPIDASARCAGPIVRRIKRLI